MDRAMVPLQFWRTGTRLAWRDLRNAPVAPALIIVAVALSIASITGVRGAADVARQALQGDSRSWLASDLCVDTRDPLVEEQANSLDEMKRSGIEWTLLETALSMAASGQSPDPGWIAVKAVDPAVYPFYGALRLSPAMQLTAALRADTTAVSSDVLARFQLGLGDTIQIGGQPFRIVATIAAEPDRFSDELGIGMRSLLSQEGYQRTGIARSANSVKYRVLIRLPRASDLLAVRHRLLEIFPEGNIRDYRGAHRQQTAVTETSVSFLSITAFLALALGAMGVAIAVRQHANARLPSLAILRILGARSGQLAFVFFSQIAWMLAAGLAIGVPLGFAIRATMLSLAARYMVLPVIPNWNFGILESSVAAIAAMAPVLIGPALLIGRVRPGIVLRQNSNETTARSAGASAFAWIAAAIACAALAELAYRMLRSWNSAYLLAMGLAGTIAIAWALSVVSLYLLRRAASANWTAYLPSLRHGIAMLYRPGNHSRTVLLVLATVFAVLIATFEASAVVVRSVFNLLPYDRNSLYLAGFRETDRTSVRAYLERQPGIDDVQIMTQARLELRTVKNPPFERLGAEEMVAGTPHDRREVPAIQAKVRADGTCQANYTLDASDSGDTCVPTAATLQIAQTNPSGTNIRSQLLFLTKGVNALTADQWNYYYAQVTRIIQSQPLFPGSHRDQTMTVDYYLEQRVNAGLDGRSFLAVCRQGAHADGAALTATLAEDAALPLGAKIGARLELASRDRVIQATVTGIRPFTPAERFWSALEVDCSGLNPASLFHQAALRIRPGNLVEVEQAIRAEFPTLAIITPDDIAGTIRAVSDDAMALVRIVSWYLIGAGLSILIAVVAASRAARLKEIGIFSALGARRKTLLKIYTAEFVALGILAGLIANLISSGFTSVLLLIIFQRVQTTLEWSAIGAGLVIAAVLTLTAGWLPAYGLLRSKPMEVLRRE
jgi:predicted lysophospholipase L1 biosynthesis ABC-type transport system permease subunit